MSKFENRAWLFYIEDMLNFAEKVLHYTQNFDQIKFVNNSLTYDAVIRNLELIGEAATNIPPEIRSKHPLIPWRMIIATRNKLIHGYLGIDNDTLWNIIQEEIPDLIIQLNLLKKTVTSSHV